MISCIAAVDEDFGIGYNGQLLERIPEDMQHFKTLTFGHDIIMGRKTFDSFPNGALPFRQNIIISKERRPLQDNAITINLEEALNYIKNTKKDIFVIGGGSIYRQLMPYCDILHLTHIYTHHDNIDVYFPNINDWKCFAKSDIHSYNDIQYQFKSYHKAGN